MPNGVKKPTSRQAADAGSIPAASTFAALSGDFPEGGGNDSTRGGAGGMIVRIHAPARNGRTLDAVRITDASGNETATG
jgi:hypothetical protein